MFGVTSSTVRSHIDVNQIGVSFPVGNSMTKEEREIWGKFISQVGAVDDTVFNGQAQSICASDSLDAYEMTKFAISFSGKIDAVSIANSIFAVVGPGAVGRVEITCVLDK
jgi:hypothetical protein